jgi:hypothetical protein
MANNNLKNGDKVKVVRGKKVPIGTTGVIFWMREEAYGLRLGIKDSSTVYWTAAKNVELVTPVTSTATLFDTEIMAADIAAGGGPVSDASSPKAAMLPWVARVEALEKKVAELTAALALTLSAVETEKYDFRPAGAVIDGYRVS